MTYLDCDLTAYKRDRDAHDDQICTHLITLRNLYTVRLVRVSASPMDPLFKVGLVEKLNKAIEELDNQIANNQQKGATQ